MNPNFSWSKINVHSLHFTKLTTMLLIGFKGYCTSPGYSVHPLFGCYSLVQSTNPVTIAVARQECAKEGGQLLLVKSEEERKELMKLLPCKLYLCFLMLHKIIETRIKTKSAPMLR